MVRRHPLPSILPVVWLFSDERLTIGVAKLAALLPPIWLPHYFSYGRGAVWLAVSWTTTILVSAALNHALARPAETEDEDDA